MVAAVGTEIAGIVRVANARGVKLEGEAEWRNISKWAEVVQPNVGERVVLRLDGAGFIRSIVAGGRTPKPSLEPGAAFPPASHDPSSMHPERLQARTAALSAATRIAGRPTSVGEVLALAEQITSWLLR